MVCQITAGSLLLSAIACLRIAWLLALSALLAQLLWYSILSRRGGQHNRPCDRMVRSAWQHPFGEWMGGMIAQEAAINSPQRVRSLTSIMSTTGNPRLPQPTREAAAMLLARPPLTYDEYIARFAQTWKVLRGGGSFPLDEAR